MDQIHAQNQTLLAAYGSENVLTFSALIINNNPCTESAAGTDLQNLLIILLSNIKFGSAFSYRV